MKNKIFLDKEKKKYKGNLHCHSTRSDGTLSAEDVIDKYKEKGYNFLLLSDHEKYWRSSKYDTEYFIMLSGYEREVATGGFPNPDYHFNGIFDESTNIKIKIEHDELHQRPLLANLNTAQNLVMEMKNYGNIIIFNHPTWSRNTLNEIISLNGYFAIDIYNSNTELYECSGSSTEYWDYALQNGKKIFAVAVDDAHCYDSDENLPSDYGKGWVMVEGDFLEKQIIVRNLKSGNFYSSTGPEIYDIRIKDDKLKIECSPVEKIKFKTSTMRGKVSYPEKNKDSISLAEYVFSGKEKWVRIECVDKFGKTAWSNPVFID